MNAAAQAAQLQDAYWAIRIGGILAAVLLLAMIRLPAALIIIGLGVLAAWMAGAL